MKTGLNQEQRKAVNIIDGPMLIIAGAGSGKTRVITHRIVEMLRSNVSQSSILALTFTNKASKEMTERIVDNAGHNLPGLTVSTFHSFGVEILKKHISLLGWRKNFTIYDTEDQKNLIKECARELLWNVQLLDLNKAVHTFSLIKTARAAWNDDIIDTSLRPLYEEYQQHRILYNALDFDDLIQLPIELFHQHPDLLEKYHKRYRYIMIDEFQDTSKNQYELMKLLSDGSRNICVVGDDDQSIYSWRGANFSNIRNFERDYPERREIKLEQNYRSTGAILNAANHLIQHNKQRKAKLLWSGGEEGRKIAFFQPDDEYGEAKWICDQMQSIRYKEGVHFHDTAILIRTNHLTRPIEEELLSRNIPYRLSGGTSFFERAEIKDVISYLRCISNPHDDISLLRILNKPRRGIGKQTLNKIRDSAGNRSLYSSIKTILQTEDNGLSVSAITNLEEFVNLVNSFRPRLLSGKGMSDILRNLILLIDYWGYLTSEFRNNENIATFRWKNIESFAKGLERWERETENASIFNYLNRIMLSGKDADSEEGKLNLMTIHSAKGLEFETVFIAGVQEDIIPHRRSLEEGQQADCLEEERRLFYVALTRAKRRLYLTSSRQRQIHGRVCEMNVSPFLTEIPANLISNTDTELERELSEDEAAEFFNLIRKRLSGGQKE